MQNRSIGHWHKTEGKGYIACAKKFAAFSVAPMKKKKKKLTEESNNNDSNNSGSSQSFDLGESQW